ncbi:aminopeptidase P family protein [Roseimarinus sediminis]|uniref:aminopeptidase P family protein n=1 Tax=Roseimarinus sediminis TaxID=1610899 RepID=UPI003D24C336
MNSKIQERLQQLRKLMKEEGLNAYLINGSDPHMSEYVPERWQTRAWISNFTGSFGWLAITADKAALWTDSRYYLQAGQQLDGTGFVMMKARVPDAISLEDWLASELNEGETVGFDGSCYPLAEVKSFEKKWAALGIKIESAIDLPEKAWTDRPALSDAKAFMHPLEWAGKTRREKITEINEKLQQAGAEITVLTALDDLGWTFNIRGADVECNPVVLAFAIIGKGLTKLFVDGSKFSADDWKELKNDGVDVFDYALFYDHLRQIKGKKVLVDPARTNYEAGRILAEKNQLIEQLSIPQLLKSVKIKAEIEGMKKAHVTDGLALLDFQLWLEEALLNSKVTEYDVALQLAEFRAKRFGYVGTSFFPIVGYRDHGAIVHFRVSSETANVLEPEGILLFDSGGQYQFGTTDITRTIALGAVSNEMKRDFTLVLKGMIKLSKIRFPKGTIGCHLDVLAREALWNEKLNYGHGTGHGVGAFMNVHEGPGSIRPDLNSIPLQPGNIFSNEPGMYREGKYGIRTENLILVVEDEENEFGSFMRFETLTRYPIDTRLVDKRLLSDDEIKWLNQYHQDVLSSLSPFTNSEEFKLLKRLTQAI